MLFGPLVPPLIDHTLSFVAAMRHPGLQLSSCLWLSLTFSRLWVWLPDDAARDSICGAAKP